MLYPRLPAVTDSAAEILAKLLSADGIGSGLDADLVRGVTPGTIGLQLLGATTAAVIGVDLGGSSLLRVGGSVRMSGQFLNIGSIASDVSAYFSNSASSGYGVAFDGGGQDAAHYIALFGNYLGQTKMTLNGSGQLILGTALGGGALLQVNGSVVVLSSISLTGDAAKFTSTYGGITTTNLFTDTGGGVLSVDGSNAISLRTGGIAGTTRLAVNSDGTVTVGPDPSGSHKFRVGGDVKISEDLTLGARVLLGTGSYSAAVASIFKTAADGLWLNCPEGSITDFVLVNSVGQSVMTVENGTKVVQFYDKIKTLTAVPGSFADLAAVQVWLAAQFT